MRIMLAGPSSPPPPPPATPRPITRPLTRHHCCCSPCHRARTAAAAAAAAAHGRLSGWAINHGPHRRVCTALCPCGLRRACTRLRTEQAPYGIRTRTHTYTHKHTRTHTNTGHNTHKHGTHTNPHPHKYRHRSNPHTCAAIWRVRCRSSCHRPRTHDTKYGGGGGGHTCAHIGASIDPVTNRHQNVRPPELVNCAAPHASGVPPYTHCAPQ